MSENTSSSMVRLMRCGRGRGRGRRASITSSESPTSQQSVFALLSPAPTTHSRPPAASTALIFRIGAGGSTNTWGMVVIACCDVGVDVDVSRRSSPNMSSTSPDSSYTTATSSVLSSSACVSRSPASKATMSSTRPRSPARPTSFPAIGSHTRTPSSPPVTSLTSATCSLPLPLPLPLPSVTPRPPLTNTAHPTYPTCPKQKLSIR